MTVVAVYRHLVALRAARSGIPHPPPPDAGLYWTTTGDALADAEAGVDVYEPDSSASSSAPDRSLADDRWPAPASPHTAGAGHPTQLSYRHLLARIENLESRMAVLISNHQHR